MVKADVRFTMDADVFAEDTGEVAPTWAVLLESRK